MHDNDIVNITPRMTMGKVLPALKNSPESTSPAPLPLGWTKIKRKKRKVDESVNPDFSLFCCDDPSCPTDASIHSSGTEKESRDARRRRGEDETEKFKLVTLTGKALFCLHALDCNWFQGQFMNSNPNSVQSLALLAEQRQDVDPCVQCVDGGYKEIDLSIFFKRKRIKSSSDVIAGGKRGEGEEERKKLVIQQLSCTGGDMLRIRTPSGTEESIGPKNMRGNVSFDSETIVTGTRAESMVRRYFPNLLPSSVFNDGSFSEKLPDCAVVIGDMSLIVPKEFLPITQSNDDDSDGWLE